jgi:hypothetical protein
MKARNYYLIFCFCVVSISSVFAQPGDPGGDPDVPITGIEILIGAGGVLGLKKAWENRKKKNK